MVKGDVRGGWREICRNKAVAHAGYCPCSGTNGILWNWPLFFLCSVCYSQDCLDTKPPPKKINNSGKYKLPFNSKNTAVWIQAEVLKSKLGKSKTPQTQRQFHTDEEKRRGGNGCGLNRHKGKEVRRDRCNS